MLNDLTRPMNMDRCQFRQRRDMASHCHYVWMRFLRHLRPGEPRVDLMVWEIGETVRVRPASTAIDESNPNFQRPLPLFFQVWGYAQERRKIEKRKAASAREIAAELASLERELWDGMLQAIVDGLNYKNASEAYRKYNPDELPFAVVATAKDEGLHKSKWTLAWKNDRGPTVATIRRRAKAARGRPLPQGERELSRNKQHLAKLAQTRKKQTEAARKYRAREKESAEKRKPAARRKLAKRINEAAALPVPTAKTAPKPRFPLSLDQGNQHQRRIVPSVPLDKLVDIQLQYKWADFDEYDNRVWEYSYALLEPAVKQAKAKRITTLWNKLNRPQKSFLTFLDFVGQVDNGGVWQFLYNSTALAFAALEVLEELGAARLARDYRITLEELVGKAKTINSLRKRADDKGLTTAKRWTAFVKGYQVLESTERIEKYFYTNKFKASLFRKMSNSIEASLHLLARVPDAGS